MRVYLVAAFSERPFAGNPAGVCLLERPIPGASCQAIARELRQPETAFLFRRSATAYDIRWFSPTSPVELCGHATLAAAHVLWSEGHAAPDAPLTFHAAAATLEATPGEAGQIWLDFPALPGILETPPEAMLRAVSRPPVATYRHNDRWLFEYAEATDVRALRAEFMAVRRTGARSLIVTAPSDDPDYDIVSRNFAPIVGVLEDQVTGMAHTCLAPHWASRLGPDLRCYQASQRGGALRTRLRGDRVHLGGRAVLEFAGEWRPPTDITPRSQPLERTHA